MGRQCTNSKKGFKTHSDCVVNLATTFSWQCWGKIEPTLELFFTPVGPLLLEELAEEEDFRFFKLIPPVDDDDGTNGWFRSVPPRLC